MHDCVTVETKAPISVTDITGRLEALVPDSIERGVCTVFVSHTTAGVTVNEAEPRLLEDMKTVLADLVDGDRDFGHDEIDDNAAAHLQSMLLDSSVTVPVSNGTLDLGTWQSVLLVDSDGPRRRTVDVTVVADRS